MLSLVLAAALLPGLWSPESQQVHDMLDRQIAAFPTHRAFLERRFGATQTIDLGIRLVSDAGTMVEPAPDGDTDEAWHETMLTTARADLELLSRAVAWPEPKVLDGPGLHAGFVKSPSDGIWEPLAVYVPRHHAAHPPIAIVIHGRPQTETELLGQPYFRMLADSSRTVLVAPWGRGSYDLQGAAETDIVALLPTVQSVFDSDTHQNYLVGYSMGGFTVFKIGTTSTWAAVMCISGSMLNSEVKAVRFAWRSTPVHVINGSSDLIIPPLYGLETAVFLDSLGIPTSFYQQTGGSHAVRTLIPQMQKGWSDMHLGIVRQQSIPQMQARNFITAPPAFHDSVMKP